MEQPLWVDRYDEWEGAARTHGGQAFPTATLRDIERLLPREVERSAETGCGKSTILLSNIAKQHTVFALDDRDFGEASSILFLRKLSGSRGATG